MTVSKLMTMTDEEYERVEKQQRQNLVAFLKSGKVTNEDWDKIAYSVIRYLEEYGDDTDERIINIIDGGTA